MPAIDIGRSRPTSFDPTDSDPTSFDPSRSGPAVSEPTRPRTAPDDEVRPLPTVDGSTGPQSAPEPGVRPLLAVTGADLEVPIVTGGVTAYTHLDYAASAPCLAAVATHLCDVLPYYSSIHRGAGYCSQVSTAAYERARAQVAQFVGARPDDVLVFTRNTTDALNLLANCVPTDGPAAGNVVFLDVEHHANLLPWRRGKHRFVLAGTTQRATVIALRAELAARPAALVAVTGASNVTGEILPIDEIVAVAHAAGARVVVDAAQLAPHRRIDLASSGIDYVAFSGHKLYAPWGAGALVGRRDWLDEAPAYLPGGGAVREVGLTKVDWADAPERHEGGTPNVLGAVALARACEVLSSLLHPASGGLCPPTARPHLGASAVEAHEEALRVRLTERLRPIPGVRLHRIWRDSPDAIGVVAFSVEHLMPGFVAAFLSAEHGIAVRDGRFCAHPLLSRLGAPDGAVRASFGVGNTLADVDRLADAVESLVTSGARWTYELVGGRWVPSPDPRPAPSWAAGQSGSALSDDLLPSWADALGAGSSPCEGGVPS